MIEFSERDRDLIEDFLNHVLDRYKAGSIGRPMARAELSEAMALAAADAGPLRRHMRETLHRPGEDE